jgi:hypothetical protein
MNTKIIIIKKKGRKLSTRKQKSKIPEMFEIFNWWPPPPPTFTQIAANEPAIAFCMKAGAEIESIVAQSNVN